MIRKIVKKFKGGKVPGNMKWSLSTMLPLTM